MCLHKLESLCYKRGGGCGFVRITEGAEGTEAHRKRAKRRENAEGRGEEVFEFVCPSLPSKVWVYFLKRGLDVKTTLPCSSVFSVSSVIQTKAMSEVASLAPTYRF